MAAQTKIQAQRLAQVLEAIEANQDHWDQELWHCGTSHCFAGFANLIKRQLPISSEVITEYRFDPDPFSPNYRRRLYLFPNGEVIANPMAEAKEWLGITGEEAWELFDEANSLLSLRCIVTRLCAKYG